MRTSYLSEKASLDPATLALLSHAERLGQDERRSAGASWVAYLTGAFLGIHLLLLTASDTGRLGCLPTDDGGAPTSSVMAGRLEGGVAARWPLHPGYMHSFGATCAHFVLVEQPLSVSVPAMVRGQLSGEPLAASLRWFADQPVRGPILRLNTQ